ncbi:hypothetical protein Bhyg_01947 [Pseudolycoriella hygida]|uniref:Uncharacterized protein n=1 Tax=Pseudolycoriella hygida TaxID=35572 RepID=A0A9Q0S7B8_9DIPT|nr:hypothetical protein Bhyg_01947 [Pseudolycoriella hygida]
MTSPQIEYYSASGVALPPASKDKYIKVYDDFQKWNQLNGNGPITEKLLLKYFEEHAEKSTASTLLVLHSMLKATLRVNDNIDISSYSELFHFLKMKKSDYKPCSSKLFTDDEIEKFLSEAPDQAWLDVKVVCIFGVNGAHSTSKLVNIRIDHIKEYEDMILVTVPKTETSPKRTFTITGHFFSIVKKYMALRPPQSNTRFFIHYKNSKCSTNPIGRNKFYAMPRRMADYLSLPETERYTVNSFRRPTVSNSSYSLMTSNEEEEPTLYDNEISSSHSMDTSGVLTKNVNQTSLNERNGLFETYQTAVHVCTLSCGQVKCAREQNEQSVYHAFTIMKPSSYNIIEVTPAVFGSDPSCRWIVAYTHVSQPVDFSNTKRKFEEITRSIPNNVRIMEKYIRRNSTQLFAAYVVVYGVNCECRKHDFDVVLVQPNDPLDLFD